MPHKKTVIIRYVKCARLNEIWSNGPMTLVWNLQALIKKWKQKSNNKWLIWGMEQTSCFFSTQLVDIWYNLSEKSAGLATARLGKWQTKLQWDRLPHTYVQQMQLAISSPLKFFCIFFFFLLIQSHPRHRTNLWHSNPSKTLMQSLHLSWAAETAWTALTAQLL